MPFHHPVAQLRAAITPRPSHLPSAWDRSNNARLSLHGVLAQKAAELRLPRNWPDRFFQHTSRAVKPEAEPTEPAPTTTPAQTVTARPTT